MHPRHEAEHVSSLKDRFHQLKEPFLDYPFSSCISFQRKKKKTNMKWFSWACIWAIPAAFTWKQKTTDVLLVLASSTNSTHVHKYIWSENSVLNYFYHPHAHKETSFCYDPVCFPFHCLYPVTPTFLEDCKLCKHVWGALDWGEAKFHQHLCQGACTRFVPPSWQSGTSRAWWWRSAYAWRTRIALKVETPGMWCISTVLRSKGVTYDGYSRQFNGIEKTLSSLQNCHISWNCIQPQRFCWLFNSKLESRLRRDLPAYQFLTL